MATQPAVSSPTIGLAERGRTLTQQHVLDLAHASLHWPALRPLLEGADRATHVDVSVLRGPSGQEVLIQPRSGDLCLPAEFYALVPGAFGASAAYDGSGGAGLSWHSSHAALQAYLETHEFGAAALPGGHRSADREFSLAWTVQLSALATDRSLVVCQLSHGAPEVVAAAFAVVDRLGAVTAQSVAPGPQAVLQPLRFGALVELALSGKLDELPPAPAREAELPSPPVVVVEPPFETAFAEPVSTPAATSDATVAVGEALRRYEGKRVTIGTVTDKKKLANILRGVAPGLEPDEICGFVDTGIRANGKSGAVFTATAIHFTELSGRRQYLYSAIDSFELESSAVIVNGTDGSRAKISTADQAFAIAEGIAAATGLLV